VRTGRGHATGAIAGLTALTLVVAACSSSAPEASSATSTTGSTTTVPADVPTAASAGCATDTPPPDDEARVTTTSGGETRSYLRYVPQGYANDAPMPLVVDFHGYLNSAQFHSQMSGLAAFGDRHGFITIAPEGRATVRPSQWDVQAGSPDLAFVGDLLDEVEAQLCVDTNRVYVTGLSNGAMMTSAVACAYADRIAAVAPVAGLQAPAGCAPGRAVPAVTFHGTADEYLQYDGGLGSQGLALPSSNGDGRSLADTGPPPGWDVPDVAEATAAWAVRNGCPADDVDDEAVADDVTRRTFGCAPGAAVELYTVTDGGHTWPGSPETAELAEVMGPTTMSISANEIMWEFFEAHPLR
jgi:polyhydroxybutyrate depolymerase